MHYENYWLNAARTVPKSGVVAGRAGAGPYRWGLGLTPGKAAGEGIKLDTGAA